MSYRKLVEANVTKAFNLVKDLAYDVVLTKKQTADFNFSSGETQLSSSQTVSTKAIVIEATKKSDDRNTIQKQIMLKTKDVGDINNYSTVSISGVIWKIGSIQKDDGFVITANIFKEN